MEIADAKPENIPSKLRSLMAAFQSSPFHVAPEREAEMVHLRDKYGIRIQLKADAKDWLFEEFRIFELNRIFVGLRSLEGLWAYCYACTAITTELQKASGAFAAIENPAEYQLAFKLLDWASQERLVDREGEWPNMRAAQLGAATSVNRELNQLYWEIGSAIAGAQEPSRLKRLGPLLAKRPRKLFPHNGR